MSGHFDEQDGERLEQIGARAFRLLSRGGLTESAANQESSGARKGPPDQLDAERISAGLAASLPEQRSPTIGRDRRQEAQLIGNALLRRATAVLARMKEDGPRTPLSVNDAVALESVLMVRGRPSLRVQEVGIEPVSPELHPGSGMWSTVLTTYERQLLRTAASVGAVMVDFTFSNLPPQVVGTAWVVGDGTRAITNRHVIFPPGGSALARRSTRDRADARLRSHIKVWIDFAHTGPGKGPIRREVTKVLAATDDGDPIDAAILELEAKGPPALRLLPGRRDALPTELIYVIGHPGKMMRVPEDVASVFGNPDGEKRISFGETMLYDSSTPQDLIHDGSTIGGFSGGFVGDVLAEGNQAVGLHYLGGSPASGNRALRSQDVLNHALLAALLQP